MKSLLLFIAGMLFFFLGFTQKVDTVVTNTVLKSYFSYETRTPLFVTYILYKGGGDCSRKGMTFKTGGLKYSATKDDYAKTGYDIGHMANAEDFANDCDKERETFFFYNALPQRAKLNRGIWRSIETKVRNESQIDSLLIVCGGYDFTKKIGSVSVPGVCFKILKNLKTKAITCYKFPNDNSNTYTEIGINELLKEIPFKVSIYY